MRRLFNVEQSEYFISIVRGRSTKEIAELMYKKFGLHLTKSQIVYQKSFHKVTSYDFFNSREVAEWMRDNVPNTSNMELVERLENEMGIKCSVMQIRSLKTKLGLSSGLKTYVLDNKPYAGRKMSKETYEKVKHTMFKKGDKPLSTAKIGEERFRRNVGFIFVKVSEKSWVKKQTWVWEQTNGPIPKGSYIIFADGNSKNCDLSNLLLVTKGEHERLKKRQLISDIPDITRLNLELIRLEIAREKAKERLKNEKV